MTNLVNFLESLACDARMARVGAMEYAAAAEKIELPSASRNALIAKDVDALAFLHGAKPEMWCMIFSPEQPEHPDQPGEDDVPSSPSEEESPVN